MRTVRCQRLLIASFELSKSFTSFKSSLLNHVPSSSKHRLQTNHNVMSYDPKVFALGWDFILAGEKYRALDQEKIPVEDQAMMCGLFKQATFGDIDIKYADRNGPVLDNCRAWHTLRGLTKPEAIKKYVEKSNELVAAYQG